MKKPCEYCGCDLPLGVDKDTRRIRSRHFASCKARPSLGLESPAPVQEHLPIAMKTHGAWDGLESLDDLPDGALLYTTAPPAAQPAVPDAMTSADIQEHIEYVAGWNDCRQAMLEMMK
jgi:hypothetical protein